MASRSKLPYIECKTYGHAWDEYNPRDNELLDSSEDRMTLRCTRCATTRHDYFAKLDGELVARRYHYPDGYRQAVDHKPSRAALRLMLHGYSTRGIK